MSPEILKLQLIIKQAQKVINDLMPQAILKEEAKINDAHKKIDRAIKKCTHSNHVAKYGGNCGNYDPTADIYWVEVNCMDCGQHLRFYDHQEEYNRNWNTKKNDYI